MCVCKRTSILYILLYIYTSTVVHLYMSSTNYTPLGNNDGPVPSLFRLRWVFGLRIMSTAKKMSTMTSFGRIRGYFGGSSLYISPYQRGFQ